jgi:type 1 glutamine amidotransferase
MSISEKKQALIFWGGWEGHTPERSGNIVREMLERNGFDVRMVQGTAVLSELQSHRSDDHHGHD